MKDLQELAPAQQQGVVEHGQEHEPEQGDEKGGRAVAQVDQELGQQLFQMMLDAASGKKTKSEQHGYGQNEFVPWQISVYT